MRLNTYFQVWLRLRICGVIPPSLPKCLHDVYRDSCSYHKTHAMVAPALQITILTDSTSKAVRQFYVLYVKYCSRKKYRFVLQKCWLLSVRTRIYYLRFVCEHLDRSRRPRGLKRPSAAARLLQLLALIPPGAWMSVSCDCCALSSRGLYVGLITRPEESYRVWCV